MAIGHEEGALCVLARNLRDHAASFVYTKGMRRLGADLLVLLFVPVAAFVLELPPLTNVHSCTRDFRTNTSERFSVLYSSEGCRDGSYAPNARSWTHRSVLGPSYSWSQASRIVSTLLLCLITFHSMPSYAQDTSGSPYEWNFGEDRVVKLETPLHLSSLRLDRPTLLGAGGGGAVVQMQPVDDESRSSVAVKISWIASAHSVFNECMILQKLEKQHVHNVERCLATDVYPLDPRRVMIALEPVFADSGNSLIDIEHEEAQVKATRNLVQTLVDMLAARVVATDVQLLVSQTGEVLLVDLTEAKALSLDPSPMDMTLAASFCSEILSQVPASMYRVADIALRELLVSSKIDDDLYNILASQRDLLAT